MTLENQRIRDCLKAAECRITNALRTQPERDSACKVHLLRAAEDVKHQLDIIETIESYYEGSQNTQNNLTTEKTEARLDDKELKVVCYKCGELLDLEEAERFFSSGGNTVYICKQCALEEEL